MTNEENRKQIEEWSNQACDFEFGENGKEQNLEKAFELYKKCAEYYDVDPDCEDAAACLESLGEFYYEGKGPVAQDYSEAKKWFEKAINANRFYDWSEIAKIYEDGLGIEADPKKAVELYLQSEDVEDWKCAYNIYHTGKIADPEKENEIRKMIALYKRSLHYHDKGGYRKLLLAAFIHPKDTVQSTPFSKELFINYFNSDFPADLRTFFDISYNYGDRSYPFVSFVAAFGNKNHARRNIKWDGYQHYHMFSVSLFYLHTLPQAIGHLYGYRMMEDFLRSTGWPLIHCGMGGHMHPIQVMYEGVLYPLEHQFESYINILNTAKDFIKEDFSNFLQGGAPNCNQVAYTRLCETVVIKDLLDDIEAITDNYVEWIKDPGTEYPHMLFGYSRK